MISPMTKYSFVLLSGQTEEFLSKIQDLGVIDITRSLKPVDEKSEALLAEADKVKKALAGYGVEDFAEFQNISDKINASDGNVTYVAKAYDLVVNGNKLAKRALGKNGQIYLPSVAVATALKLDLQWNSQQGILTSPYGIAPGYVKSDVVYMNAVDAYSLFHLRGELTPDYVYNMYSVKGNNTPTVVISPGSGND